MGKILKKIKIFNVIMIFSLAVQGCTGVNLGTESGEYVDFTVVKDDEIPEDLLEQINKSKEDYFKITYRDDEYLYIANGYGKQNSGGYSLAVKQFYILNDALYFESELVGPKENEGINEKVSYPYIVIKTEIRENPVVFR